MPRLLKTATPIQLLVLGFAIIVLFSAFLLAMPFSSSRGEFNSYVDCVCMTSSAISTTGLVVLDIGKDFNLFGQLIMLLVVQIGGIGYMCFLPLIVIGLMGGKLSIGTRMVLRESMARPTRLDMVRFTKVILVSTGIIELLAAICLALYSMRTMPIGASIYTGIYHSINAFCTAGMSTWSDNLVSLRTAVFPNIVLNLTELIGGIGFFVLYDIARQGKRAVRGIHPRSLTTHSKLALTVTGIVVVIGTLVVMLTEWHKPGMSVGERVLTASFQSISASTTTGFNTVDIGALGVPALFMLIVLMFIGASPNSTGGGIKTTTLGVMVAGMWALLRGREDITMFKRRIPKAVLHSAFSLTMAAMLWCVAVIGILVIIEPWTFLQTVFEVISAFGNVGLSTGITMKLTTLSKILLSLTMFYGRLGPLAIGFSLIGKRESPPHHFAEDEVYVG